MHHFLSQHGQPMVIALGLAMLIGCERPPVSTPTEQIATTDELAVEPQVEPRQITPAERIADAAAAQTGVTVSYDPAYVSLAYPGGDVDPSTGVCTDVVVRALRGIDVDLQQLVYEDMTAAFSAYPDNWGLRRPDPNIDHRRVPNLMRFFERQGKSLPVSDDPADYQRGDIVVWRLNSGLLHCGIVDDAPTVVHNIGRGTQRSADLFTWPIKGHYRWTD